MNEDAQKVKEVFKEKFKREPRMFYSPGRINFIGEHVDYNDGFVMPAAINKGIYYAISPNSTGTLNFSALDFNEDYSIEIAAIKKAGSWRNYVLSIVNEFVVAGKDIGGFDCVFGGNVPNGGGLSSSAAVEGGLAFGINEIFKCGFSRKELALLGQRAEHNYPGVMCGIMDQYANMQGKKDQVILLDCRSVEHEYLPLKMNDHQVVLINTNVHHSLASSEYNVRRKQCEEGLKILQKEMGITSFRDVENPDDLLHYKIKLGEDVYKRCLYVVQEIRRTQEAAKYLKENMLSDFGELMFATHDGLSKLYNVSCNELDFLVDEARKNKAVIGSRMMGGGFGGCTINIIENDAVENFIADVTAAYQKKFQIDPDVFQVEIVDGTHEIK